MSATMNPAAGQARKEQGMQAALDFAGAWSADVLDEFRAWLLEQRAAGRTFVTIEAFRAKAWNQPCSHYAWGSLPTLACRAGLIAPRWVAPGIQDREKASSVRTNGHEVKRWDIVVGGDVA